MEFKDRLQQAMDKKGIRPADLSRMTGIGEGAISQYRKGAYKAGQRSLEKIANALGVSINWLMGMDDDPPPISSNILPLEPSECIHIQKYRRLTDNGRATVDNVIDGLLEAGQPAHEQEQKEPEKILLPVAARGGTGEPLEVSPDTARLLEETKEWRREQIKNSDVF